MVIKKFNRGEMYWYHNPDVDKNDYGKKGKNQDFLDDRPVLIISDFVNEYDSSVIIISSTTSPHRYGIDVEIVNCGIKEEISKLMPMRIREVPIKYLRGYIGKVDDNTLEKIYNSIDYHFGRTDVIPDYVIEERLFRENKNKNAIIPEIKQEEPKKQETKSKNNKPIPEYPELDKMRNKIKGKIGKFPGDGYTEMKEAVYKIKPVNKHIKRLYESISSYKSRLKCVTMSSKDISKVYKVTVNQAILIKELCTIEFAIDQLKLMDKLASHELAIKSFNTKNKIIFLTLSNSLLDTVVKKGDVVINYFKSEFIEEIT